MLLLIQTDLEHSNQSTFQVWILKLWILELFGLSINIQGFIATANNACSFFLSLPLLNWPFANPKPSVFSNKSMILHVYKGLKGFFLFSFDYFKLMKNKESKYIYIGDINDDKEKEILA